MGNSCPGSRMVVGDNDHDAAMYQKVDRVNLVRVQPSGRFDHVVDHKTETHHQRHGGPGFQTTYRARDAGDVSAALLVEHYQPYEFPICPVINSDTQRLVRESWQQIMSMEFDSNDVASGKVSGASYFYNHFFTQLFSRLDDFKRIFPDIKSRAEIFSKVMGFCISIRIEELDFVKVKLKHLGQMHKSIIHHPYLFGIYATNMHSTIRHCLGDFATHEIMSAWLHLLAWILRGMLPAYFAGTKFTGHYSGAVNASSSINEKARDEVKATEEARVFKSRQVSMRTESHSSSPANKSAESTMRAESLLVAPSPSGVTGTNSIAGTTHLDNDRCESLADTQLRTVSVTRRSGTTVLSSMTGAPDHQLLKPTVILAASSSSAAAALASGNPSRLSADSPLLLSCNASRRTSRIEEAHDE